jgi:hypothetical protein
MASVVRIMRTSTVRAAGVLVLVALATGCAQQPTGGDAGGSLSPTSPDAPAEPAGDGLVLEVAHVGGFVTPQMLVGRLPQVAVYADGRAITQGPVIAIYPGPALPNLQVQELAPEEVQDLVDRALAAGVGEDIDYGRPTIADAPSTRITLVTDEGTQVTEVYALSEALSPGPGGDEPPPGLTEGQIAARAELQQLIEDITSAATSDTGEFTADAIAAVVTEWTSTDDGLPPPEPMPWPGPPLPGEPVDERLGVSCVAARGEAADAVLEAARDANQNTPWTSDDGTRWSLILRPLLPHESGCADLADG